MSLPTIGKQQNPGEAVTEVADRDIRRLCSELASVYCSFEEPDHTAALHKAIEDRIFHILQASAHDGVNEVHGDLAGLRSRDNRDGDLPTLLEGLAA